MESNNTSLLACQGLGKKYGNKIALQNINLTLGSGKIIGLLGPNGSGKTTFIKLATGLLTPSYGNILINGSKIGPETKSIVSYLPERTYLNEWMSVTNIIDFFKGFYEDFREDVALNMLDRLSINPTDKLKTMSKGTKEKVQLILVMSRSAKLYLLDEPISGVDPAAREYIINTIINNYNPESSVIISTHLITDIENILDEVVFIQNGTLKLHKTVDEVREEFNMSVDSLFREVFRC